MTLDEFSAGFDVRFNNITSNQAPGLNEYEKSLFLTTAQDEILKNHFSAQSPGNNLKEGFDDSAKRQADFSMLMKTAVCNPAIISGSTFVTVKKYICSNDAETTILYGADIVFTIDGVPITPPNGTYNVNLGKITGNSNIITVTGFPYTSGTLTIDTEDVFSNSGRIDQRSKIYAFPSEVFIIINEVLSDIPNKKYFQVIPMRYDDYTAKMSKPFKRPLKHQAWRLLNSGTLSNGEYIKCVEVVAAPEYDDKNLTYTLRYLRRPLPIIVSDLDGLTINGKTYADVAHVGCELDPILHEEILQRAVELAKISWTQTGQDNSTIILQSGQRSE